MIPYTSFLENKKRYCWKCEFFNENDMTCKKMQKYL